MAAGERLRTLFQGRPWWINLLMLFCAYMTFLYLPFDLFWKPVAEDQEVWLGFLLTGWAAKATEPLHWLIYALGFYGFLRMRPWMHPWAGLYVLQIAIGTAVWMGTDPRGAGWILGLAGGAVLSLPAVALWRAKALFVPQPP